MGEMVKVTGLWENETSRGDKYFSGSIGGAKILIFKNGYKDKDNQPDYILYFANKQRDEEGGNGEVKPEEKEEIPW